MIRSDDGRTWRAVDPAAVQARVVAPLGQQGAELIAESAHWAQAFSTLSHVWRRSPERRRRPLRRDPRPRDHRQLPRLAGRRRRGGAAHRAAAVPPRRQAARRRRRRPRDRRPQARRQDAHALPARRATRRRHPQVRRRGDRGRRRGAHPRRVLQPPASWSTGGSRSSRATRALDAAMVISDRSMVGYLVDMFERHWERARPFTSSETSLMRDIAAEQRAMTIRMLLEGRADPAGAKRLGVSPRTYAGLRRGPEERVRGGDAVPARLRDGQARHLRPGDRRAEPRPRPGRPAGRSAGNEARAAPPWRCCPRAGTGLWGRPSDQNSWGVEGSVSQLFIACPSGTAGLSCGSWSVPRWCRWPAPARRRWRADNRIRARPRVRRRRYGVLGSWGFHLLVTVTGDDMTIVAHRARPRPVQSAAGLCIAGSCKSMHGQPAGPLGGRGPTLAEAEGFEPSMGF